MLGCRARPGRLPDRRRLLRGPRRDGLRARRPSVAVPPGDRLLGPRGRVVRCAVADHPHHQRRAAGADARRDGRARWSSPRRSRSSSASSWPSARTSGCRSSCSSPSRSRRSCSASIVVRMVPAFQQMQERIDGINRVLREQITGIRVVRAFVREPEETARFDEANEELTATSLRGGRLMTMMFPTVNVLINVLERRRAVDRRRPDQQRRPAGRLAGRLPQLPHPDPDVGRDADVHAVDGPAGRGRRRTASRRCSTRSRRWCRRSTRCATCPSHGRLELRDVGFHYPGAEQPVLNDISFTTTAGQTTAIIGSTGAGKTTLVNLVPRLFDATSGAVLVDGVDVRELDPELLWGRVGSCRSGRTCSPAPSPATCASASPTPPTTRCGRRSRVAQAADFVRAMPGGLEARIEQGGTNVSGGQRQRLSIARALVRKPEIYLFDDSFSALDLATDARLRAALRAVHDRVRRGDRRPAGVDDRRAPTRSSSSRTASSSGAAPTIELLAVVPDVRRDRAVADRRAGDGGMSERVFERANDQARSRPSCTNEGAIASAKRRCSDERRD